MIYGPGRWRRWECVDAVYLNGDPTAAQLLAELKPDIYVKGPGV